MPNSITKFKKYIDKLDAVYKYASVTAALDSDPSLAQAGKNANEIVIPKISMQGLGDYSRSNGYASGDVTVTNETVQFNYERGRKFTVDAMDNEETAGVAFGKLSSEFIRTKVAPELDAFRFATYAGTSNIGTTAAADLSTGADVIAALRTGTNAMDEAEVPTDQRMLFITPTLLALTADLDTNKSKKVLEEFKSITKVPQTRFYTGIKLNDGRTSGEEAGGYAKATGAKNINFMIISKDALMQYTKHLVNKVITPEENQDADAWAFFFRAYGLADVYENKTAGIYLHKATT
ncbi:MAG: hypothetical protein IK093_07365 [Ruminiclostridium sp.]|nr:hypothetical protein [Ruminiclostridium sp.]